MAAVNHLKVACKCKVILHHFILETRVVANTYQFLISLLSVYLLDASLDGMEILVTFALPYQGVFTEAVEIIPIPAFVKKAGKDICVMNPFVRKYYFLTFKTITDF